jgi:membrane-bound ClpP family serine protease
VHLHGENWHARTSEPLKRGQKVRVVERDGLTLVVQQEREEP